MGRLPIDRGDTLGVVYTGYILDANAGRGAQFDSNDGGGGAVLRVRLGQGDVIAGLEHGVVGMKKGGTMLCCCYYCFVVMV
jgi:FKBP-type peptidyl-prolyl cis-trans isomerase FkpA